MTTLHFKKEDGVFRLYTNNGNPAGPRLARGDGAPPLTFEFNNWIEAEDAVDAWNKHLEKWEQSVEKRRLKAK